MGIKGNLTSGEIIEQLIHANTIDVINNVVFMGMGEPLDNYDNLLLALKAMTDVKRFGLASHKICVSTVGVVPRMLQLTVDFPSVSLALSLHAPNQETRLKIVPTAKAYPIEKIINAMESHLQLGKRVMIEYILLKDVNDNTSMAIELGNLLKGKNVIINLIPYNPTDVDTDFTSPSKETIDNFEQILINDFKLITTVRRTMGQDIDSACGQLVINHNNNNNNKSIKITDIEDISKTTKKLNTVSVKPRKNKEIKENKTTSSIISLKKVLSLGFVFTIILSILVKYANFKKLRLFFNKFMNKNN